MQLIPHLPSARPYERRMSPYSHDELSGKSRNDDIQNIERQLSPRSNQLWFGCIQQQSNDALAKARYRVLDTPKRILSSR